MLVVDWNWRSFLRPGYLTPEYSKKPFTQSWLLIGESLFFYGERQKLFFGTNPGESSRLLFLPPEVQLQAVFALD
jgi:hypothetical protein